MIEIYGYVPAWDLPDISPYVTKAIVYLHMTKIPFKYKSQELSNLDIDAPFGKLPYIIDTETNTKVADSNTIIQYLQTKHNITLDQGLSATDLAIGTAFDRLASEHLYWSGIILPRWRLDAGWEQYIPYIVQGAPVSAELRCTLDAFRVRILAGFNGQGMGRRNADTVLEFYRQDIDGLAVFLGEKKFFLGERARTVDAGLYAMLRHLRDQPQTWEGSGYIDTKRNLVEYLERMRVAFKV